MNKIPIYSEYKRWNIEEFHVALNNLLIVKTKN